MTSRTSERAVDRLPSVPASGLFTSWATPATSVPREASRDETASCVRSARSSVTSCEVAMPMITAPESSRTGEARISMSRPLITVSNTPGRPCNASRWTGSMRATRSGEKISESVRPTLVPVSRGRAKRVPSKMRKRRSWS